MLNVYFLFLSLNFRAFHLYTSSMWIIQWQIASYQLSTLFSVINVAKLCNIPILQRRRGYQQTRLIVSFELFGDYSNILPFISKAHIIFSMNIFRILCAYFNLLYFHDDFIILLSNKTKWKKNSLTTMFKLTEIHSQSSYFNRCVLCSNIEWNGYSDHSMAYILLQKKKMQNNSLDKLQLIRDDLDWQFWISVRASSFLFLLNWSDAVQIELWIMFVLLLFFFFIFSDTFYKGMMLNDVFFRKNSILFPYRNRMLSRWGFKRFDERLKMWRCVHFLFVLFMFKCIFYFHSFNCWCWGGRDCV